MVTTAVIWWRLWARALAPVGATRRLRLLTDACDARMAGAGPPTPPRLVLPLPWVLGDVAQAPDAWLTASSADSEARPFYTSPTPRD